MVFSHLYCSCLTLLSLTYSQDFLMNTVKSAILSEIWYSTSYLPSVQSCGYITQSWVLKCWNIRWVSQLWFFFWCSFPLSHLRNAWSPQISLQKSEVSRPLDLQPQKHHVVAVNQGSLHWSKAKGETTSTSKTTLKDIFVQLPCLQLKFATT